MAAADVILPLAVDRIRRRCAHATVYTHDELRAWLSAALPAGWTVRTPSVLEAAFSASWPSVEVAEQEPEKKKGKKKRRTREKSERDVAEQWLRDNGCVDPANLIDGACEPLALFLSNEVKSLLLSNMAPDLVVDYAHGSALRRIRADTNAPQRMFGCGFTRGFQGGHATWTPAVWGDQYGDDLSPYLYGGIDVQARIGAIAASASDADSPSPHVVTMPLYVLAYIWDGDELDEHAMLTGTEETAQYSCHVVGLVLDTKQHSLVVADPNGGLLPGGNMEFLSMPIRQRASPSTSVAQFDLEH